ncbi:unnamed protein product [Paramecium sonneborni]|uniref:Uncharacterized protein n=1 Tax=Paramecium sonneborni TaxID=65129 RepID=A0A8S1P7K0_9CILI|nr:unnamed protein product [Paramecium sonneborni]
MRNNNNQQFKYVAILFPKYKIDSEIYQTLSSQQFLSINPQIQLLPKIQPMQIKSQPNSPVKVKSKMLTILLLQFKDQIVLIITIQRLNCFNRINALNCSIKTLCQIFKYYKLNKIRQFQLDNP